MWYDRNTRCGFTQEPSKYFAKNLIEWEKGAKVSQKVEVQIRLIEAIRDTGHHRLGIFPDVSFLNWNRLSLRVDLLVTWDQEPALILDIMAKAPVTQDAIRAMNERHDLCESLSALPCYPIFGKSPAIEKGLSYAKSLAKARLVRAPLADCVIQSL